MKQKFLQRFVIGAALLVGLGGAGMAQDCTPQHQFKTINQGFLTVAVTNFAPFSFMDENGKPAGIDVEIAEEFAKKECLEIRPIAVDPAAGIQYVLSGQADIVVGAWYRTVERAKVMGLSLPLYLDNIAFYSREGIDTVEGLIGKKVATIQGYLWVTDARNVVGDNLSLYPSAPNARQDLIAGRVDVLIDTQAVGIYAQRQGAMDESIKVVIPQVDERIRATKEPSQIAYPYAKTATDFGTALDASIAAMAADGTIAKILTSWGVDASAADTGDPRVVE